MPVAPPPSPSQVTASGSRYVPFRRTPPPARPATPPPSARQVAAANTGVGGSRAGLGAIADRAAASAARRAETVARNAQPTPSTAPRVQPGPLPTAAAATRVPNAVQAGAAALGRTPFRPSPGLINPFAIFPAVTGAAKLTGALALVPAGLVNKDAANLSNSLGEAGRKDHDAAMAAIFGPLAAANIYDPAKWEKNPLNPFGSAWDWAPWNKRNTPNSLNPTPKVEDHDFPPGAGGSTLPFDFPAGQGSFQFSVNVNSKVNVYGTPSGQTSASYQSSYDTGSERYYVGIPEYLRVEQLANTGYSVWIKLRGIPEQNVHGIGFGPIQPQGAYSQTTGPQISVNSVPGQPAIPWPRTKSAELPTPVPNADPAAPPQYEPTNKPEYPKKDVPDKAPAPKIPTLPFLPIPARAPSPSPGIAQPPAIPAPTVPGDTPRAPATSPAPAASPNPLSPGKLPPLNQRPGLSQLKPPQSVTDRGKDPVFNKPATPTNTDLSTQLQGIEDKLDDRPSLTCQYKEDDLATVPIRVYQGENLLTGPQYGVKTIQIHEKMSEFATEHFNHLSEVRGQAEGLRGRLKKILDRLQIIRIINLMGAVSSVHNAAMLSNNLAQTLGDATSTVITAVGRTTGFMSAEESIDVNQILGETFNDFMKASLGETVWNGTKASWKKANRILSAASQIMFTIRSINDSRREMLEWIGENTGKIGNALKKFGVVGEGAYKWMPEKFNIQTKFEQRITKFREGAENIDDAASSIESVASEVVNVHDEVAELKKQRDDFEKLLKEATGKDRPDNDHTKAVADTAKTTSQAQTPTPADMEPK